MKAKACNIEFVYSLSGILDGEIQFGFIGNIRAQTAPVAFVVKLF